MRRLTLIFIICLAVLSSCSPAKQLSIDKISLSGFRMESSTEANVTFDFLVNNMAQYPISLTFMEATIKKDMDLFAFIALEDTATVSPLAKESVKVPIDITLCDPMSLLSMGLNINKWDINAFTISGKISLAGKNGSKYTHKIKEMPLGTLLKRLEK
ncbi:MAG: hypothetical protein IKW65_05050 [Bacteroidales bacterium]|nr:hypothetical protein [Bacteroidales bacterium]